MAAPYIEEQKMLDHILEARRMARERRLTFLCHLLDMAIAEAEVVVEDRSAALERVVPISRARDKRRS